MADIRVVVQVNALERMIIVDGKTEFIGEDYWNDNIQNVLNVIIPIIFANELRLTINDDHSF